ncbi:MAG: hypothetical protein ABJB11_20030 [Ferruginibacter sp.]
MNQLHGFNTNDQQTMGIHLLYERSMDEFELLLTKYSYRKQWPVIDVYRGENFN